MPNLPFHLPVLSRIDLGLFRSPGPGFGNLLFPIARALVGQKIVGGTFVEPTLRQLKIGTYIRNEKDKRTYDTLFKSRSSLEMKNWVRASFQRKQFENEADNGASVICYQGLGGHFHDIENQADVMRKYLKRVSRLPLTDLKYDVAMHIRAGDFAPPKTGVKSLNTQVPLDWYHTALIEAKKRLGKNDIKGLLFSDGDPQQLIKNLKLEGFEPEPAGNALSSILAMSQSRLLIGSRSTFSLWGQYLGGSVGIWPDGFELSRYKAVDPDNDMFL
jgi:hypothetical protein